MAATGNGDIDLGMSAENKLKKAHLIGICGAGMSAVAHMLDQQGYQVTGSDDGFYPPVSDYLDRLGLLPANVGHTPDNLPDAPDLVVIGKHAKLTEEDNAEVAAAFEQYRTAIRSFPEVLADLTTERARTVVAGSYGKSSLTSLIVWCLMQAGKDPGYFIGAIPIDFEHSAAVGTGPFIFEGDEYPSANWDDRAKFLHYSPQTVILTAATHDHVNVYPTLADYHRPFNALLSELTKRDGTLIACTDEEHAERMFHAYQGPKISYGLAPNRNFTAAQVTLGDPLAGTPTTFSLVCGIDTYPGFETHQLGMHAVENIAGAAAYLLGTGLLTVDEFRDGVASFSGLNRRLDRKAPASPLPIFEGFGSSFEKARAAIDAIRAHLPGRRLIVMFEPHTFTWRNKNSLPLYRTAFDGAGEVWLFAPPSHGADTHEQVSIDEINEVLTQRISTVRTFDTDSAGALLETARPDPDEDVVLILSSGSFGGALQGFLAQAEKMS